MRVRARSAALFAAIALPLFGCPGPKGPSQPAAQPSTRAIGRDGASLRGVAAGVGHVFTSFTTSEARTIVEGSAGGTPWSGTFAGTGGPMAVATRTEQTGSGVGAGPRSLVAIALAGQGVVGGGKVTGEPGALLLALDGTTGTPRWSLPFDSSEWAVVSAIAATDGGFIVGGSFSGSLRVKDTVVTSGARSDGFVAKVSTLGELAWLIRMGGPGADAVQGVAARGDRIAVAGTFAAGADLMGVPLAAFDDKSPFADGFVAALDQNGARLWSASFGGKQAETIAGVAIDDRGDVVVAASARDVVHVGGLDLAALGPADGLVAWWNKDGSASHAVLVGGIDFDGLRAIVAVGERIVVGGFYSGVIDLGETQLIAGGGDGAFVAIYDRRGSVLDAFDIEGAGREEIVGLAAVPGGFLAGIAHTAAASVSGDVLPAPNDPMTGAALVIRGIR